MDVSNVNDNMGNLDNHNDSNEERLLVNSGTESCKHTFQDVRSN